MDELASLYQNRFPTGGMFCPTTTEREPGQSVVVELVVPSLPNAVFIRGIVRSWRPALPRKRQRAGLIVQFEAKDRAKVDFVWDTVVGQRKDTHRRTHPRIPVDLTASFTLADSTETTPTQLVELSEKGALLSTTASLPLDQSLMLSIGLPGSAKPVQLAAKVVYQTPTGQTGVTFVSRGPTGDKRLRELVKRVRCL